MKPRLFLLALPALLPPACGGASEDAARPTAPLGGLARPAATAEVRRETVPILREVPASVRSLDHIRVSAEVAGRVMAVHADVGDRVTKGQALADLDPSLLAATRDSARAALDLAEAEASRVQRLRDQKVASEQEYDTVQMNLRQARATLEAAETALSRAQVLAPVDGVVEERLVGAGDLAVPGTPLYSLYDPARLCLEAHVPVGDREHVSLGTVLPWALAGATGESPVSEVAPSTDPRSRTFRIRVPLPRGLQVQGDELAPGMFGTVSYRVGQRERISVPAAAVRRVGQVEMVVVQEDGRWVRRSVRSGATRDGQTELLAGMAGGETVGLP